MMKEELKRPTPIAQGNNEIGCQPVCGLFLGICNHLVEIDDITEFIKERRTNDAVNGDTSGVLDFLK